jgi:hypothetical protein
MSESARLVQTGTVSGTPIQVDVTSLGSAVPVSVTLSVDYVLSDPRPPGFPFRPGMTGTDAADLDYPRTIPNGTTVSLLACEANALINAGVASLA